MRQGGAQLRKLERAKSTAQVEADAKQEPEAKVAREQDEGEPKAKAKARSLRREHLGDLLERACLEGVEHCWARRRGQVVESEPKESSLVKSDKQRKHNGRSRRCLGAWRCWTARAIVIAD